jgi:hypothetical protein
MEDYEKHILDRMYLLLDGKLDVKGPEESKNNEDDDDNGGGDRDEVRGDSALPDRPENWMFHGYISFLLDGPTAAKE